MDKEFILYGYSGPTDGTWRIERPEGNLFFFEGEDFRTVERYREYADCGFNTLFIQGNEPYVGEDFSTSALKSTMDKAIKAGLRRIIVHDSRLFNLSCSQTGLVGEGLRFSTQKQLEDYILYCIKDYRKHPAFFGFMLIDEPTYKCFTAISEIVRATKKVAPEVFVQCNLLPLYHASHRLFSERGQVADLQDVKLLFELFREYIVSYLDKTEMPYLLYDSYPMRCEPETGNFLLRYHIPGLQISAEETKKRNRDFYLVCQSVCYYTNDRIRFRYLEESDMRWQINCALAFGVKSVSYYTYWAKQQNGDLGYHLDGSSFIYRNGKKAPLYYIMQKIHAEMKVVTPYLLDCKYVKSTYYSTSESAPEFLALMEKCDLSDSVKLTCSENAAIVITELKHEHSGDKVICLFNANDPKGNYALFTEISPIFGGKVVRTFSLKHPEGETYEKLKLDAGDGIFFVIKKEENI